MYHKWGLGIGDWAQTPKPQTHNPNPPTPLAKFKKLKNFL